MKTIKDAKLAIALCQERWDLEGLAQDIGAPGKIALCLQHTAGHDVKVDFDCLQDELRELLMREVEQQIAAINKKLEALGIDPNAQVEEDDLR